MARRTISPLEKLEALLDTGAEPTIEELCEHLGLHHRQVRRWLTALRKKGRVVEEKRVGKKAVYFIPEEHREVRAYMVKLMPQQLLALAVASRAAEAVLDSTPLLPSLETANTTIMAKLTEAADRESSLNLGDEAERWYFPDAPLVPLRPEVIATLVEGMRGSITVEISYYSMRSGQQRWRKVDPMTFAYREGSWLMCAWCHKNQAYRTFALADVHAAILCREKGYAVGKTKKNKGDEEEKDATPWQIFTHDQFNVEEFFRNTFRAVGGDSVPVRLLVAAPQARSFRRKNHHPTQQIEEEHPDGSITVSMECAGLQEVSSFILGWGAGVTVLEPKELQQQLRAVALEVAEKYR